MFENIQNVKIKNNQINPTLLYASLFNKGMKMSKENKIAKRYVYDYEIEFLLDSKGSMIIEDTIYPISKGDLVFRRPGQLVKGVMPYSCYLICFDMTSNSAKTRESYIFDKNQQFQFYYLNMMLDAIPPVFHPESSEKYHQLFDSVLIEFINCNEFSSVLLKSLILQIIFEFHRDVINPISSLKIPCVAQYKMLENVIEYIQNNIQNKLSLNELSDITKLSPNYFHKIFTKAMGTTPNGYVTKIRIDKGKELLVRTGKSVADIAVLCGFENTPYFSYLFKKQIFLTPGEFRNKYQYF
ncbi:MAG: helix-turn-helix transcriptional regulator [Clostridium sp.]|uniref:helix-turn-helix transcriptional regulator n=1 Tax=Clostridium sp. TaxID=1506 RepID=UPI003D6CF1C0